MKMLCGDQTTAYIAGGRVFEELYMTGKMTLADHLHVQQQPPCV